jgi:hypothetical protein
VHEGRVRQHRRLDIHDVRQDLVLDLDQVERLLGDRLRGRCHRRHRVALIEHLALGHTVQRQITQIVRRRADMGALGRYIGKIGPRHHRLDAGQAQRLLGVDRDDAGMGMGAALDPAPQHPRQRHVGAEIGPAGDLVDPVRTDRPGADDAQR